MLVLTRKVNQSVFVGGAKITIFGARAGAVRIGIEAPQDVPIAREEIVTREDPDEVQVVR